MGIKQYEKDFDWELTNKPPYLREIIQLFKKREKKLPQKHHILTDSDTFNKLAKAFLQILKMAVLWRKGGFNITRDQDIYNITPDLVGGHLAHLREC